MSVTFLDNNAAYSIVNAAYNQAVGAAAQATQSLADFVDGGIAYADIGNYRDKFTKALLLQGVKNIYLDSAYKKAKNYGFRVEDMNYDAILQAITFEIPEAQASHAWKDFTDPLNPATVGTYTVKFATTTGKLFGKTASWELQFDFSEEQLTDAFKSEEQLLTWLGALRLNVANSIEAHDEVLDEALRNVLLLNIFSDTGVGSSGAVNKIDLRAAYNEEMTPATDIATAAEFMANADCLKFASRKITEYKGYIQRMSTLFNMARRKTFTPVDRIKLQVLNYFEQAFNSVAQSGTFHDMYTALPGYETVPFWQSPDNAADSDSTCLSFEKLSGIDLMPEGGKAGDEVQISGIVALLADKWSILHAVRSRRTAVVYHEPENLYQNFIQFRDCRAVLDSQNAIVFYISDEDESEGGGGET